MAFKNLEKKSEKELNKMLAEERGTLYDLRMKVSVNQLKKVSEIKTVKKRIAQILTRLSQMQRTQAAQADDAATN